MVQTLFDVMLPRGKANSLQGTSLARVALRKRIRSGPTRTNPRRFEGRPNWTAQNRLPASAVIENAGDVVTMSRLVGSKCHDVRSHGSGRSDARLIRRNRSRDSGSGRGQPLDTRRGRSESVASVLQARRRHRTFLETHLAKSRKICAEAGNYIPHVFTTSYLTHAPIREFLARQNNYRLRGPLFALARQIGGLRLIPTARDLRFMWQEMPQQMLDEQQQKVRDSLRARPDRLGANMPAKPAITRITCHSSACIQLDIGMKSRIFSATECWRNCSGASAAEIPAAAQHRYRLARTSMPGLLGHPSRAARASEL